MTKEQTYRVSDEQLKQEKEIDSVVDLYANKKISKEKANELIEQLLNDGIKNKIFSKEDVDCFIGRKDTNKSKYGPRSHIKFAMDLRDSHVKEKETFSYFIDYLKLRSRKEDVLYESFGSDDNGYIMISNFRERYDSPINPDYKVSWKNRSPFSVEVKNFHKNCIWLKVNNLRKYKEWGSYLLISFCGGYYFFSNAVNTYFLKNVKEEKFVEFCGKKSITITENGENSHFSLNEMIKNNLVKKI